MGVNSLLQLFLSITLKINWQEPAEGAFTFTPLPESAIETIKSQPVAVQSNW
jgi:hypothetical protein